MNTSVFSQFLLHIGDSHLILSHRLSEWCGHAPELELDIALANIGLDLLGQARTVLSLVEKLKDKDAMKTVWLIFVMSENIATYC